MYPRLNMVMVSTQDVDALRQFYETGLGWTPWMPATPASVLYKLGTVVLVFLNAAYQAKESGIEGAASPKSIWAIFVDSRQEVETVFKRAIAAGGTITSALRDRDGGLYSGYFADPEGNGWEVVWSPHMAVAADGSLTLPGA
jgi:uncharacterized protein